MDRTMALPGASRAPNGHITENTHLVELHTPAVNLAPITRYVGCCGVGWARAKPEQHTTARTMWCWCVCANVGPSPVDLSTCCTRVRHFAGTLQQHTTGKAHAQEVYSSNT